MRKRQRGQRRKLEQFNLIMAQYYIYFNKYDTQINNTIFDRSGYLILS